MDYQRLLNHVHPEEFDPTYKTLPRFVPVLERGANVLGSQANTLALPSCQCILGNFCPQAELQLVSLHRGWCLSRKSGLPFFVTLNTVRKSVLHHNTRISTSSHMSYHWLQQLSPIPNKRADLCCFVYLFVFVFVAGGVFSSCFYFKSCITLHLQTYSHSVFRNPFSTFGSWLLVLHWITCVTNKLSHSVTHSLFQTFCSVAWQRSWP